MIVYYPIFVGASCNNQCPDCPARDKERHVDFHSLEGQLDGLSDCENIALTGGDPILYNDVFSLIASARRHGAKRIKMISSGREFADWNLLGRLLEEGCRIFEIKMFGSTPEIHDSITRSRGSFDYTFQGMANLAGASDSEEYEDAIFVTARIEVTRMNLEDLAATMGLAASLGVDRIVLVRRGVDFNITTGARIVSNVIRTATLNRIWSMSEGFPPCIMKGTERHLAELLEPTFSDGTKSDGCQPCLCRDLCPGPPSDYTHQYGHDEFKPITVAPYMDDVKQIARTRSSYGKK